MMPPILPFAGMTLPLQQGTLGTVPCAHTDWLHGLAMHNRHLNLAETPTTPSVQPDHDSGLLLISGVSAPENANNFYEPILDWVRNYVESPATRTVVRFDFDYFNTASSKMLLKFLTIVKFLSDEGKDISYEWCYSPSDIDMLESAEDYATLLQIPMKAIPKEATGTA